MLLIDLMLVAFNDSEFSISDIPKIRDYFSNKFQNHIEFHNHIGESCECNYSEIQFRLVNRKPTLLGINNGIEMLKSLVINEDNISFKEKTISLNKYSFGQTNEIYEYKFVSPWLALNDENLNHYNQLKTNEKTYFLNTLLKDHIKSLSDSFKYSIPDLNCIDLISDFLPINVKIKNHDILCFKGSFKTNFMIPDYLGIGKQSTRGFGTVVKKFNNF